MHVYPQPQVQVQVMLRRQQQQGPRATQLQGQERLQRLVWASQRRPAEAEAERLAQAMKSAAALLH